MKHLSTPFAASFFLATLFFSCNKKEEFPTSSSNGPWVNLYNACVDCDEINASMVGNTDNVIVQLPFLTNQGYHTLHPDYYALTFYNSTGKVTGATHEHFYTKKYYGVYLSGYEGNGGVVVLENKTATAPDSTSGKTYIRFLNLCPDSRAYQWHIDNEVQTELMHYKDVSSYYEINEGEIEVSLTDTEGNKLLSKLFSPHIATCYTLLVTGVNNGTEADSMQLICVQE